MPCVYVEQKDTARSGVRMKAFRRLSLLQAAIDSCASKATAMTATDLRQIIFDAQFECFV